MLRQLGDADLEDETEVTGLLEKYGEIKWPYFLRHVVPHDRERRMAPMPPHPMKGWFEDRSDGTLEDARWWLKTLRALAAVWRETSIEGDAIAAWRAEDMRTYDEEDLWYLFSYSLNLGLKVFHARAELPVVLPSGRKEALGLPRVNLYSAGCRQVFNLIVGEQTARRCENQTCGRTFVHQLGGALHGQYRSKGLRFCSPECARAETQRQYRRRKAAEKVGKHR